MPLIRPETIASLVAGHVASAPPPPSSAWTWPTRPATAAWWRRHGGHRHHRARRCHRRAAGHHRGEHLGVRLRPGGARQGVGGLLRPQRQGERYLTDVIGVLVGDDRVVGAVAAEPVEGAGVELARPARRRCGRARDVASTRRGWPPGCSWRTRLTGVDRRERRVGPRTCASGVTSTSWERPRSPPVPSWARRCTSPTPPSARGPGVVRRGAPARRSAATPRSRPFVSLRQGTVLEESSKAGTFVEIKGSVVGQAPDAAPLGRR